MFLQAVSTLHKTEEELQKYTNKTGIIGPWNITTANNTRLLKD